MLKPHPLLLLLALALAILTSCNSNAQENTTNPIIFQDDQGNKISKQDLKGVTGTYNWQIMNDTNITAEAQTLHQEARQHGGEGAYDLAIQKLKRANEIAPDWAYPLYDLGYTYLLQQDFPNALKYYGMVDELEPRGFFTAKTAHWSLKKEAEGVFLEGLYLAFMQIEWRETDEEKVQVAKAIVSKFPEYAPAWQVIAGKSDSNEERLAAVAKGLAANPDAETKGMLLINEALVRHLQGETEAAKQILGKLVFAEGTTVATIEMAKFVLSSFAE